MSKITDKTLIPIGLALITIGGGAIWMTRQEFNTTANASSITALTQKFDGLDKKLGEILEKLGTIEGELRRIPKRRY